MKTPKVSSAEAVKTTYPQLAAETKQLKATITELGKSISGVEESLQRIGLEVSAWHKIAGGVDDFSGIFWSRDIGYSQSGGRWRITLRDWSQDPNGEDSGRHYVFAEAPPWMIIEAAGKIPALLEELINRTQETRKQLVKRKAEVDELAAVLADLAKAMRAES